MLLHKEVVLSEATQQGALKSEHWVKKLNCTQEEKLKEEYVC